jgi:hypothetical protein
VLEDLVRNTGEGSLDLGIIHENISFV